MIIKIKKNNNKWVRSTNNEHTFLFGLAQLHVHVELFGPF